MVLFMLMDSAMKLLDFPLVLQTMTQLGYPGIRALAVRSQPTFAWAVRSSRTSYSACISGCSSGVLGSGMRASI